MLKHANVGQLDRALRLVIGAVLVIVPFVSGSEIWNSAVMGWGAPIVGLVLIATAFMRFCPIYKILGLKTCKATPSDD